MVTPVPATSVFDAPRTWPPARDPASFVRFGAVQAARSRPSCFFQGRIEDAQLAALGGAASVPCLAAPVARLASLALDPRAAFVLSRIDGASSVEDVIDVSGLSRSETLKILHGLLKSGVIRTSA
jgi:hypothetical protein